MGVLDELKQTAEELKAKEDEEKSTTIRRAEQIRRDIAPKMKELYTYFKEFCDHLNVVSPDVTGDYLLEGLGTLTALHQGEYKLATDDPEADTVQKFTFHWTCSRDGRQDFRVANGVAAEQFRENMWNLNLRFKKRDVQNGAGAVFTVDAYVPVSIEFEADYEKEAIRLRMKNLGALGVTTYYFAPDRINSELMDELAKSVLRRPNRFDELSGNTLSDTLRKRIREQLEEEKRQRDTELQGKVPVIKKKDKSKAPLTKRLFGKR